MICLLRFGLISRRWLVGKQLPPPKYSHQCALINLKYIIAIKSKQLEFNNRV